MVPFLGTLNISVPYYNKDPKRDHNFDNHPYDFAGRFNVNPASHDFGGLSRLPTP